MAELIAYFSRKHQNYVNGMLKNLEVGNMEIAAGIIQRLTGADLFKLEPYRNIPGITTNASRRRRWTRGGTPGQS